jgi:hypothetical protein
VTVLLNTTLGATRASGLSAPVSVLVSFATVQQGSCWIAMPVVAASRCGLNVDDRPKLAGSNPASSASWKTGFDLRKRDPDGGCRGEVRLGARFEACALVDAYKTDCRKPGEQS